MAPLPARNRKSGAMRQRRKGERGGAKDTQVGMNKASFTVSVNSDVRKRCGLKEGVVTRVERGSNSLPIRGTANIVKAEDQCGVGFGRSRTARRGSLGCDCTCYTAASRASSISKDAIIENGNPVAGRALLMPVAIRATTTYGNGGLACSPRHEFDSKTNLSISSWQESSPGPIEANAKHGAQPLSYCSSLSSYSA
ncbi:hypothetical protein EVAR_48879_1 [Eumeta japonica]|uniref:Uncharacterized protein n=1 Tax=Eumeta variegata TaxID=151549 RepID=A0A4C1Y7N4_EUMVA|nr:hypothetical protein EVAR_48879_1 [Eumeta japonica]